MTESPEHLPPVPPLAPIILPRRRHFPTWGQAVALCGLLFLLMLLCYAGFVFVWTLLRFLLDKPVLASPPVVVIGLFNALAFAAVLFLALLWGRVPLREMLPVRLFRLSLVFPMTMLLLGAGILLSDLTNLVSRFIPMPENVGEVLDELVAHPWQGLIVLVVIAPITEELLFRGVILRGFLRNYSVRMAFVLSALLFGVIHLNPWQFVGAFFLGIIFAWWRLHTGSLLPCLYGHALNNAMPFIMAYVLRLDIPGYSEPTPDRFFQPLWFNAAGFVLALWGYLWLRTAFRRTDRHASPPIDSATPETLPPVDSENPAG